jgi:hypothetical protein
MFGHQPMHLLRLFAQHQHCFGSSHCAQHFLPMVMLTSFCLISSCSILSPNQGASTAFQT